ncbi:hypothetical protein [Catellatospora citrea]|uniref:hypothetical protein n=1 Tax=Catellatospora citrea TaxID=53366 RepID=UPI000E7232E3|nr:hypothetical protein [Catellatospora citrea]RKE11003.1 hypothetical protein C8E86_5922 [Catellatospora citrea]
MEPVGLVVSRRRVVLRRVVVAAVVAGAMLVAGCGGKSEPQASPSFETTVTESASPTPSPAASAAPSPTSGGGDGNSAPTFPNSAKAYAQALLSAWGAKNSGRIDQLADQATVQQIKDSGYPNSSWTYIYCDGDNVHTVCIFRNTHGDVANVKMLETQLGHPVAVVEALVNKTTYPAVATDYVSAFVYAWQQGNKQRLQRYADNDVAAYFAGKTAPVSHNAAEVGSADGFVSIKISTSAPDNAEYSFKVRVSNLGKAEAITACSPGCD